MSEETNRFSQNGRLPLLWGGLGLAIGIGVTLVLTALRTTESAATNSNDAVDLTPVYVARPGVLHVPSRAQGFSAPASDSHAKNSTHALPKPAGQKTVGPVNPFQESAFLIPQASPNSVGMPTRLSGFIAPYRFPAPVALQITPALAGSTPDSSLKAILAKGIPAAPLVLKPKAFYQPGLRAPTSTAILANRTIEVVDRQTAVDRLRDEAKPLNGTIQALMEIDAEGNAQISETVIAIPSSALKGFLAKVGEMGSVVDQDLWQGGFKERNEKVRIDLHAKTASLTGLRAALVETYPADAKIIRNLDDQIKRATENENLPDTLANAETAVLIVKFR